MPRRPAAPLLSTLLMLLLLPAAGHAMAVPNPAVTAVAYRQAAIAPAAPITLTVTVRNSGRAAQPRSSVRIWLSDRRGMPRGSQLTTVALPSMRGGASRTKRIATRLPRKISSRHVHLVACVDPMRRIADPPRDDCRSPRQQLRLIRPAVQALTPDASPGSIGATFLISGLRVTATCSVDGASAVSCTSPFQAAAAPGLHRLEVTATDRYGNAARRSIDMTVLAQVGPSMPTTWLPFTAAPASFQFGEVLVDRGFEPAIWVTISDPNHGASGAPTVTLLGYSTVDSCVDGTTWCLVGTTCSGVTLTNGATCTLGVRYRPASIGTHTAQVLVSSPGGASLLLDASGTGIAP